MSSEAVSAVSGQLPVTQSLVSTPAVPSLDLLANHSIAGGEGVFDKLVSSLGELDARMQTNARAATEIALGQSENLHRILIDAERTRMQFDLAMSMRNRVLEAYQEIMRMQV